MFFGGLDRGSALLDPKSVHLTHGHPLAPRRRPLAYSRVHGTIWLLHPREGVELTVVLAIRSVSLLEQMHLPILSWEQHRLSHLLRSANMAPKHSFPLELNTANGNFLGVQGMDVVGYCGLVNMVFFLSCLLLDALLTSTPFSGCQLTLV